MRAPDFEKLSPFDNRTTGAEMNINSKIGIATLALAAATTLAIAPADARWRGHHHYYHHHHGYGGAIAGFAAGALMGGALASRPYYDYGYAYAPAPSYSGNGAVGYCMSRFKSYDPASGTYLGYDGYRHPCP
jgi:hypothetical protein